MSDVDIQAFMSRLQTELQQFHSGWSSRIDAGAKPKDAQLWANGYTVRVDLTEDWMDSSPKYDKLRMVIFRDSRDPMSLGEATEAIVTKIWCSVRHQNETRWKDDSGTELTIQHVFSAIRAEFCRAVEVQE